MAARSFLRPGPSSIALLGLLVGFSGIEAGVQSLKMQRSIEKGLNYLVRAQTRRGNWWANRGAYPVAMTALSGLALACEGSTTTEGKYSDAISAAVDYLISQTQPNGLIGSPRINDRYTYGHGFSLLFLSQIFGEEEDLERRARLHKILTEGVKFIGLAQTKKGGWGYVSAKDGRGFDEGSVTVTQIQGLRGAKNAGIVVPGGIIERAIKYIEKCTSANGGVRYSLSSGGGGERPAITAAGIAVVYSAGGDGSKLVPKMFKFCESRIPISSGFQQFGHQHYTHLYYSQACYFHSEEKWKNYISKAGPALLRQQQPDGRWSQNYIGDVFSTACTLIIFQLENRNLPIFQR